MLHINIHDGAFYFILRKQFLNVALFASVQKTKNPYLLLQKIFNMAICY